MAKRQQYNINGEQFPTKKALQERIKSILHSYRVGETLNVLDFAFMSEVLKNHPHYDQKLGVGIVSIGVQKNAIWGQKEFYLTRADGSSTDFSYTECLSPRDRMADFRAAAREAVSPFVIDFKQRYLMETVDPVCPYTGEALTFDNAHVDHQPPNTFDTLLQQFISLHGIDIHAVAIGGHMQDNVTNMWFEDMEVAGDWVVFHNANANLRVISKTANLSHVKRGL